MDIEVKMFGIFRNLAKDLTTNAEEGSVLRLKLPENSTVSEIKKELARELTRIPCDFDSAEILAKSALANDERILEDSEIYSGTGTLAVLPPVCGG